MRDGDFRTSLDLAGLTFTAGRRSGVRWRGDGNGVVHGIEADLQGDALDRPPQSVFALDRATLAPVGEARLPAPAWVIETKTDGDKPVFLYVDKASATIVREVLRDGRRVVTTTFDRFEPVSGALRARHWRIDDGTAADAVDVTVDMIEPAVIGTADIAFPPQRRFAPATPLAALSRRRDRTPAVSGYELPAWLKRGAQSHRGRPDSNHPHRRSRDSVRRNHRDGHPAKLRSLHRLRSRPNRPAPVRRAARKPTRNDRHAMLEARRRKHAKLGD